MFLATFALILLNRAILKNKQARCAKSLDRHLFKASLRCNGSSNMIYLKDLKENKRFIDIGLTMAKWPGGDRGHFFKI